MSVQPVTIYTQAADNILQGKMNLATDNFNLILVTSAYSPAVNSDSTYANVSANELAAGGGYTTGGLTLTGLALSVVGGAIQFIANSAVWAGFSAGPFRYAVGVHRAGVSLVAADLLLFYADLTGGGTTSGSGGTYTIQWSGSGVFQATHSP